MNRTLAAFVTLAPLLAAAPLPAAEAPRKTALLPDDRLAAIVAEASAAPVKDAVATLAQWHRVQASAGFHDAAAFIAARARAYGLEDVTIHSFPADGVTRYGTFLSYLGWEATSGVLTEAGPKGAVLADYGKSKVALADYSNTADVTAPLVDVGGGTKETDYAGKDVRGKLVLAGGNVAAVHALAVEKQGAAGIVSFQQNQTTGWSGDYPDNVRWGHLSPYGVKNTFAFMVSLRKGRELAARLARGEEVRLHAKVVAKVVPDAFEVVTGVVRGSDPAAGEVLVTSHLCHQSPGANDDASGAATALEVARVTAKLVKDGKLPRPRRTIRVVWAPEIAGTQAYLFRNPEVVRVAKAAIHLDMVGGSHAVTKAILHLTRTPASLPSAVSDVAAVFGEYVIAGSKRAAMAGDATDAIYAPDGTKEILVADVSPFTMGSDHDVLQEGSYRIPSIYLNDWPDVFIHTNNDLPSNLDPTKLRRVAVIATASTAFLASAGPDEAKRLALEVLARGAGRQGDALRRALLVGDGGTVTVERFEEAQRIVDEAARVEREALASVKAFAPGDASVESLVGALTASVAARAKEGHDAVARHVAIPAAVVPEDPASKVVPRRNAEPRGPVSVYYADYLLEKLGASSPVDEMVQYETLNLVDGKRSAREIRDVLRTYAPVSSQDVVDYLKLLEKAGLVTLGSR